MFHSPGTLPDPITTRLARISIVAPGLVEQRYHRDAKLDIAGFEENWRARYQLVGDTPHVMLSVFPDRLDFDLSVATTDHFGRRRPEDRITALAVVAMDNVMELVAKLHFAYYPPSFALRIFNREDEARVWLQERLAELGTQKDGAGH